MMRKLCSVLLALGSLAAAQSPIIRAHLEPAHDVMVGEPVRLVVTVLVPNYFTGSPDFPEFELENVIVVLPQETPQNSSERVNGTTYAGITEVYTLYPQQPGDFSLPPAQVDVPYANAPPKTSLAHLTLPPLKIHANIPAAAEGLAYFLPTTKLTMQERWSPAPKSVRVGDTIERTITVTAAKMQAMLIPPLPVEAPSGIRVYQEEPSVQDEKSNRNEFLFGQRTQTAKYFIQKEGSYTLPAIELKWWNLSTRRLMTAQLPAVHFEAAANPGAATELPPEQPPVVIAQQPKASFWMQHKRQFYIAAAWLVTGILVLWLVRLWLPKVRLALTHWKLRRSESERTYFQALLKACNNNRPGEAYSALLRWLHRRFPGRSIDEVCGEINSSEIVAEVDRLGAILFADAQESPGWNGEKLSGGLKMWRHRIVRTTEHQPALAELNP
jgi:hypothetical protein